MNKYKVKDKVVCQVELRSNNIKAIFSRHLLPEETPKFENRQFEIISIQQTYPGSEHNMYTIAIDDDMIGWEISAFHIEHQKVDPKFKGKKFWDLTEEFLKPLPKEFK